jgi:hypothetical protein
MRKALLVSLALVLLAVPALAVPNDDSTGPEGVGSSGQSFFQITETAANVPIGQQNNAGVIKEKKTFQFSLADGWDFGDRAAYTCAWLEYFQGQNEKFEVSILTVSDYPNFTEVNDKYGDELRDDDPVAGYPNLKDFCRIENDLTPVTNPKTGVTKMEFFHDGTDHFPHMIHAGDGIYFYQNGLPMLDAQGDPVVLDLAQTDCQKLYFTPGDEPGEAWLWWDEDGPTFSHGPGEGELNCNGGPMEPVAITRYGVRLADPDIGYCTVSMHEQQCFNAEPPPMPMELMSGKSILTCPDASTPVVVTTEPLVVSCP